MLHKPTQDTVLTTFSRFSPIVYYTSFTPREGRSLLKSFLSIWPCLSSKFLFSVSPNARSFRSSRNGDFAGAAAYFSRTASTFADRKWNTVESSSLQIYAECMKVLNRKDEYVRVVMALVAKCADHSLWSTKSGLERRTSLKHSSPWVNDGAFQVKTLFPDIVEYSSQLPYDFTVPMKNYYSDIRTDQYITLCADQDGFRLGIELRQLFTNDLQLDSVHVRLVDSEDGQSRDIWLRSQGVIQLNAETSRLWLDTNVRCLRSSNGFFPCAQMFCRYQRSVHISSTK